MQIPSKNLDKALFYEKKTWFLHNDKNQGFQIFINISRSKQNKEILNTLLLILGKYI